MYQKATRLKLRFSTPNGILSTEQVWDLKLNQLENIIKNLHSSIKSKNNIDEELDFLTTKHIENIDDLRFKILKDVYITKKNEYADIQNQQSIKEHNQKILEIIAEKENDNLRNKSIEELKLELKK